MIGRYIDSDPGGLNLVGCWFLRPRRISTEAGRRFPDEVYRQVRLPVVSSGRKQEPTAFCDFLGACWISVGLAASNKKGRMDGWMDGWELPSAAANGTARPQSALKRDRTGGDAFFELLYYCSQQTIICRCVGTNCRSIGQIGLTGRSANQLACECGSAPCCPGLRGRS